jgi:hypothetical protein
MSDIYNYDYFKWLYLANWRARFLRIADSFPALAYAHGIDFQLLSNNFSEIYYQPESPEALINTYTIDDQINFIKKHATRTPNNILEIGAGRGELSCTISAMGINVTPIEIATDADRWFKKTGELYFGKDFIIPSVSRENILDLNFSNFDTILMVEVIEHITEDDFKLIWDKIIKQFRGLFIVTNYIHMHPIPIGGDWPDSEKEHCRLIDASVYDSMSNQAKLTIIRKGSHLVLEF